MEGCRRPAIRAPNRNAERRTVDAASETVLGRVTSVTKFVVNDGANKGRTTGETATCRHVGLIRQAAQSETRDSQPCTRWSGRQMADSGVA